ncbi:MAG: DUF5682 family protein, partial [Myxococcota bacterium]
LLVRPPEGDLAQHLDLARGQPGDRAGQRLAPRLARRGEERGDVVLDGSDDGPGWDPHRIGAALRRAVDADDPESLWDHLIEGPAVGGSPEATRRAALAYGWSLRADAGHTARGSDLAREAYMRTRLAAARADGAARVVAVVGAFHAAALVADPALDPLPRRADLGRAGTGSVVTGSVVTSLMPYAFDQLDSRSGYPAGIRDPGWHQRVFTALTTGGDPVAVAATVLVELCRSIRDERHVAGTPDAAEALRLALALAELRDLPAPGRRELLEAVSAALGHGELLGRGRVVARALDRVLVGRIRGALAPGTPRSGLGPHVEALLAELRLPGPAGSPGSTAGSTRATRTRAPRMDPGRLDPLRSELDRRRHVTLHRLCAAGVSYAELGGGDDPQAEALTVVWEAAWTAATDATLAVAGLRGVTLEQAAAGALRAKVASLEADDRLVAGMWVDITTAAAECGLVELVGGYLDRTRSALAGAGALAELVRGIALVERLAHGHVPGCPAASVPGGAEVREELLAAAVRSVDGLAGSDDLADVRALVALVRVFELGGERLDDGAGDGALGDGGLGDGGLGHGRLGWAVDRLAADGSPRIQGGAAGARVLLGTGTAEALGAAIGSWIDGCTDAGGRTTLAHRLQGLLTAVGPQLEGHPALLGPLLDRVATLDDPSFLARLPALRDGFDALSPAARDRLLQVVSDQLGDGVGPVSAELPVDPRLLAVFAEADAAGWAAVDGLGLGDEAVGAEIPVAAGRADPVGAAGPNASRGPVGGSIGARDRWRLMLGRQRAALDPGSARYARALDELYGPGRGEGSRSDVGGRGGGDGAPFPTVRAWGEELGELFGGEVRQEVLGRAAERGDPNALLALDPDHLDEVRPSVELLEQILALKGGLAEARLDTLRRLVDHVVRALVQELAVRVRPALTGLTVPRPTRRKTDRLDLRRTIAGSLHTARRRDPAEGAEGTDGGGWTLAPDRLVFRTRGRRAVDWSIVLVVDTSGSMDANVIHAAMMAAILSGMPSVSVSFVTFSTAVVDLSDRAHDPLALLLEVRVGGGTDIGGAIRYARTRITAPARTILVVVSDFEEGPPVGRLLAEVRAVVESGVRTLGLAALDDHARPNYNVAVAEQLAAAGMRVAALSPLALARWIGEQ